MARTKSEATLGPIVLSSQTLMYNSSETTIKYPEIRQYCSLYFEAFCSFLSGVMDWRAGLSIAPLLDEAKIIAGKSEAWGLATFSSSLQ